MLELERTEWEEKQKRKMEKHKDNQEKLAQLENEKKEFDAKIEKKLTQVKDERDVAQKDLDDKIKASFDA